MKIEVLGVESVIRFIGRTVDSEVEKTADIYLEEARRHTPIDKGRARRSWSKTISGRDFKVENSVPYIGRLEEGYSKQRPRGITGPASRAAKRRIK